MWIYLVAIAVIFILCSCATSSKGTWTSTWRVPKENTVYNTDYDPVNVNDSKCETLARLVVESVFDKPFVKIRPDILTNPVTKKRLELDMYNDELGLAVEMQGRQHYQYTPYFHGSFDKFRHQQYRDVIKKLLCEKHKINLICIPYTMKTKQQMRQFVVREARLLNYNVF